MKAKLMALILAAGLGITGIAMTTQAAQAAGASTTSTCKHENLYLKEHFEGATYYNGYYHLATYSKWYYCSTKGCLYSKKLDEYETLEQHDYEQTYYRDGTVMSTCIDCKDTYYW